MSLATRMKLISPLRIFIIASITALFMSYLGIWIRLIHDPAERTGADFIHFYSAGRIAQIYGPSHVYDLELQHKMEEEQVGFPIERRQVLPFNHLPFLIPILQITMTADYVNSFFRWVILMVLAFVLGFSLFGLLLRQAGIERRLILIALLGGLLFLPCFFSLMNGQDTALLFLGAAIWVYGLISGRPVLSGLGLSLTTIRPHLALLFAIPMVFYQRRIFLGFLMGSGALATLSLSILGIEGTYQFVDILLLSAGGAGHGIKQAAMFNLIGFLMRAMPWLGEDSIRLTGWVMYATTILGLCILWARNKMQPDWRIGLTVTLAVFVAPHLHFHDLALLLIPIYEFVRLSNQNAGQEMPVTVITPLAVSLLLLISNISPILQYTIPYLVMLALAAYPRFSGWKAPLTAPHRS
jgi:hypothetical protein